MAGIKEIVEDISAVLDCNQVAGRKALDAVLTAIEGRLSQRDVVTFRGFGAFSIKRTKARTGRNPQTGAPLLIAARDKVVFKAYT